MNNGGVSASHWPWFKKMELIVGNLLQSKAVSEDEKAVAGPSNSVRQTKRYGLLKLFFEILIRFNVGFYVFVIMYSCCFAFDGA